MPHGCYEIEEPCSNVNAILLRNVNYLSVGAGTSYTASNLQSAPSGTKYGGYDCKFIEPPPRVYQAKCPVCHLILRDPYEAMCCAYSFCYTCIQQVRRSNSSCPWGRKDKFEIKENVSMRRSLNQLEVFCTYSKDGCPWRNQLGNLQAHLDETDHSSECTVHTLGI